MEEAKLNKLKSEIRDVPDFPKKGILFRDLTTMFKDGECLHMISNIDSWAVDLGITKVVGIEARGFICGSILANEIGAGFVLLRKPGKLPADTISMTYEKEYGTDTIEIHSDAINENDIVVLHDDLLATGGSMAAAYELVKQCNPKKIYISFLVELSALEGRKKFPADVDINSMIIY